MASMHCFPDIWAPKQLSMFSATISVPMCILSIIGNGIIITVIVKDPLRSLHNPFNYFIGNLAMSDFIVGIVALPVSVFVHAIEYTGHLNDTAGKILHLTFFITVTASTLSMVALSLDRYFAISYPLKYRICLSWTRCYIASVLIWMISLTISFIYLKVGFTKYLMVFINCPVLVIMFLLIALYIRIEKVLKIANDKIRRWTTGVPPIEALHWIRVRQTKKVTRTFLFILVFYIFTYTPAIVMVYTLYYCTQCPCYVRHILRDLAFLTIALNSCWNLFIYTVRMKVFRKSVKTLFNKQSRSRGQIFKRKGGVRPANSPKNRVYSTASTVPVLTSATYDNYVFTVNGVVTRFPKAH